LRNEEEISRLLSRLFPRGVEVMTDKIQEIIFGSWFSNSLQENYESCLANRRKTLSMESEAGT